MPNKRKKKDKEKFKSPPKSLSSIRKNAGYHAWKNFLPPVTETKLIDRYIGNDFTLYLKKYFEKRNENDNKDLTVLINYYIEFSKLTSTELETLWSKWDYTIEKLFHKVFREKTNQAVIENKQVIPSQEDRKKILTKLKKYQHELLFTTPHFARNIKEKYKAVIPDLNNKRKKMIIKLVICDGICRFLYAEDSSSMLKIELVSKVMMLIQTTLNVPEEQKLLLENTINEALTGLTEFEDLLLQEEKEDAASGQNEIFVSLKRGAFFSRFDTKKEKIVFELENSASDNDNLATLKR